MQTNPALRDIYFWLKVKLFLLHLCRNPLKVYFILLISQRATRFMDILICWTLNKFLP